MNIYDRLLKNHRDRIFLTPDDFLSACVEYFNWAESNPLQEEHLFAYQGEISRADTDKVRPFTKRGLATYLGIPVSRLESYKTRKDPAWADVVEVIEQVIYTQKFENAAAGLLNASIISRDLGLAEKQEIGGITGAPPVSFSITPVESGTFLPPEVQADA